LAPAHKRSAGVMADAFELHPEKDQEESLRIAAGARQLRNSSLRKRSLATS
jgi:hypothetical protein